MRQNRLTPAAVADLSSIWDFTEGRWDSRQAEIDVSEVRAAIERISADPERGRACDEIRDGYRRYSIGSHRIYYLTDAPTVDVIRILHQRVDPDRNL